MPFSRGMLGALVTFCSAQRVGKVSMGEAGVGSWTDICFSIQGKNRISVPTALTEQTKKTTCVFTFGPGMKSGHHILE